MLNLELFLNNAPFLEDDSLVTEALSFGLIVSHIDERNLRPALGSFYFIKEFCTRVDVNR